MESSLLLLCIFLMKITFSTTLGLDGQLFEKAEARDRRDVIEEEKYYNIQTVADVQKPSKPSPWMKALTDNPTTTTKVSLTNEDNKQILPLFHTTEIVTDKPTSRGARASNENWIKLPYTSRDEDERDNVLTPPKPSGELLNNRMPRVDFVTQNKALDTQERTARTDKDSVQRTSRNDEISRKSDEISRRSEFVRPDEEDRGKNFKPVYPRQANYYPDESRRSPYYGDKYYPVDDYYRSAPPYDDFERRRYYGASPSARYNEAYTDRAARKPKRVIYYAHLPEVVRAPPSVDLRYRYSMDPYGPRRPYDGDYSPRASRYDYRYWNRHPYAPFRRDRYRDLAGAASATKENKLEEKITAAPVLPQKENKAKSLPNVIKPDKSMINNHFVDTVNMNFDDSLMTKGFQDVIARPEDGYLKYDEPYFKSVIDDPYRDSYTINK